MPPSGLFFKDTTECEVWRPLVFRLGRVAAACSKQRVQSSRGHPSPPLFVIAPPGGRGVLSHNDGQAQAHCGHFSWAWAP